TRVISKQLIPVYDKPMIYYPMSVLMLAGIRDILIISTPYDLPRFSELFGNGSDLGLHISYVEQPRPEGLAQAFILGRDFIGDDSVCLVLGDNIFFGHGFADIVQRCSRLRSGGTIFGYLVRDPERYGVVEFNSKHQVVGIEEKPERPKSRYAVPGLYFFDNEVVDIAASIRPSARGELEITDINKHYLERGKLTVELLGRGFCWLDTGTHESLQQAASYVQAVQERQGLKIACLEEIAYRLGYIEREQVERLAVAMKKNQYGAYLQEMLKDTIPDGRAEQ
ncbi:MAG TPA: glucose-1-phosphate thymidylyltransferase, partial [Desulfobulbaceae bacterium]|nr:glucose-1-phosphate thymidylyltransferase [Desulfobulbaceae bacterium]